MCGAAFKGSSGASCLRFCALYIWQFAKILRGSLFSPMHFVDLYLVVLSMSYPASRGFFLASTKSFAS